MSELRCPNCDSPDGLFICSLGSVNCADCGTFIRKATSEDYKKLEISIRLESKKSARIKKEMRKQDKRSKVERFLYEILSIILSLYHGKKEMGK